jgi:hypothetical protein
MNVYQEGYTHGVNLFKESPNLNRLAILDDAFVNMERMNIPVDERDGYRTGILNGYYHKTSQKES